MCVGLSAKVVKISNGTAVIDAGGAKREVSSQLLEDLEPGNYVMVHAGVAIAKITDEDDSETERSWRNFYNENSQRESLKIMRPDVRIMRCAVRTHMRFSGWESVNCCQNR